MTIEEFLNLPEKEQAVEAAKVLTPGPWKHDWVIGHCSRCYAKSFTKEAEADCPACDPIDINCWNTAKRLQSECHLNVFFRNIEKCYPETEDIDSIDVLLWVSYTAQPIHFIAAVMASKGAFNEE